jgi:hypothetical protein
MFISARRYVRPPKLAVAVYGNDIGVGPNNGLHIRVDLADIAAVAHVLSGKADGNNVTGRGDIIAC